MEAILTDLTPAALARAIPANLHAFFHHLSNSAACRTWQAEGLYRWHMPVAHPWFNGVLASHPPDKASEQAVSESIKYFKTKDVSAFTWWLDPELEPLSWDPVLLQQGFSYTASPPGMAVALDELHEPPHPPQGLAIQAVQDMSTLHTWALTFGAGFELDKGTIEGFHTVMSGISLDLPLRNYLGWLDGQPVASSTLFLGAGVAGIYDVGTLPEWRGRGIAAQMTLHPLLEARQMGYHAGILQASEMGFSVYQRLGFRHLMDMGHYYWTAGVPAWT